MSAPPAYDEVIGSSGGGQPAPPAHPQAQSHGYPSATDEKAQQQQHHTQQDYHASAGSSSSKGGDKVLKIWHAASGNSLVTAADEKTPIYNVIDSRAPDEQEQRQQSDSMHSQYQAQQRGGGGLQRQDPSGSGVPADVEFARQVAQSRAQPAFAQPRQKYAEIWLLHVRRGGDRNGPILATIKRHISTKSAVAIELEGVRTGIEQHSGFPHTKYEFKWRGKVFNWQKTHSAPGTSRLDGGNFVCKDGDKVVYAYSTSEDSRCDGSLSFENRTVDEGLLDIMTITGFIMRDLDDARNNPSYMSAPYGAGYGPYGNPYYANGYGFYPSPMIGLGFPLLL